MVILYIYSTCWRMKLMFYECQHPGCSNHTYSNNIVNIYNVSLNYKLKSYKMTLGLERRLQSNDKNLSVCATFTGTTAGVACLASFIFGSYWYS
jgi:hypothetical protein